MSYQIAGSTVLGMQETGRRFSPRYSCLVKGALKTFAGLRGERIHCLTGNLWVTFEDDPEDYIVAAGECLEIPNQGKVLLSGPGCYRVSSGIDGLGLAVAS